MAEDEVGLLVVMRSASGERPGERGPITAATLGRAAPDPGSAQRAKRFFSTQGLQPGPLAGISFSITGPRRRIESLFPDFAEREGSGEELSLAPIPADVRDTLAAVTTEAPPEFDLSA